MNIYMADQKQKVTIDPRVQTNKNVFILIVVWTVQSPCLAVAECWIDCSKLVVQLQRDFCRPIKYWSSGRCRRWRWQNEDDSDQIDGDQDVPFKPCPTGTTPSSNRCVKWVPGGRRLARQLSSVVLPQLPQPGHSQPQMMSDEVDRLALDEINNGNRPRYSVARDVA